MTLFALLATAFAAFLLAGIAQSVTGFGSSLVSAPILALVTDVRTSVVTVTLMSVVLTSWAAARERRSVDVQLATRLSVAGFVGLPFGLLLLAVASAATLNVLMAAAVMAALIVVIAAVRLSEGWRTSASTGFLSGVLLTSTGMNGPPLILGMSSLHEDPRRFRGTLQVVLFTQDLAAVIGFVVVGRISEHALEMGAIGALASPLGWLIGDRIFSRISATAFRRVLVLGLTASALALVITAF